jgi:CRISPR-associated protein Csh1
MKSLLDAHIKNWKLSEAENVYYILSGYAFCTYQMVTRGKRGEEEEEQ